MPGCVLRNTLRSETYGVLSRGMFELPPDDIGWLSAIGIAVLMTGWGPQYEGIDLGSRGVDYVLSLTGGAQGSAEAL